MEGAALNNATTDRLTEAAQLLMDACRHATTEAPTYIPGRPHTAEAFALAIQALFFADHAESGAGQLVEASPELWSERVRGIGMGAGACIASIEPAEAQVLLSLQLVSGVRRGNEQRLAVRKRTGR